MLDWSTVKPEHVTKACDMLVTGQEGSSAKAKGLFVEFQGRELPAKHVLRLAYGLANDIPTKAVPKFSSGDAVLKILGRLGFTTRRLLSEKRAQI